MAESPSDLTERIAKAKAEKERRIDEGKRQSEQPRQPDSTPRIQGTFKRSGGNKPRVSGSSSGTPGEFVDTVAQCYVALGIGISFIDRHTDAEGNYTGSCGTVIADHAQQLGEVWDKAAQKNPQVAALLRKLSVGGVWGELVMAHVPVVTAIVGAHAGVLRKLRDAHRGGPSGGVEHDYQEPPASPSAPSPTPLFDDLSGVHRAV